jgi:hypothetical protein
MLNEKIKKASRERAKNVGKHATQAEGTIYGHCLVFCIKVVGAKKEFFFVSLRVLADNAKRQSC